jgi:hypothetical protein
MPALDIFKLDVQVLVTGSAGAGGSGTVLGRSVPSINRPINFNFQYGLNKAVANAAVGGGDQFYGAIVDVPAGGTTTINLQSFTDYLGRSGGTLARLKMFGFALLTTAEGGTAASRVTIGNATSNGNKLNKGAVTHTEELLNGDLSLYATKTAAGLPVNGSNRDILITNDDSAVAAKVLVIFGGGST